MNDASPRSEKGGGLDEALFSARLCAGDLPQREFCERHEVAYSKFGYWRKQLNSPAVQSARTSEPLLDLSPLALEDVRKWRVELDLGSGVILRVR